MSADSSRSVCSHESKARRQARQPAECVIDKNPILMKSSSPLTKRRLKKKRDPFPIPLPSRDGRFPVEFRYRVMCRLELSVFVDFREIIGP